MKNNPSLPQDEYKQLHSKEYDAIMHIPGTPFEQKGKVSFPDMKNGIPYGHLVAITVSTPQ